MTDDWLDWSDQDDQWEGGQPPPDGYHGGDDDYTDDANEEPEDLNVGSNENYPTQGEEFIGGYPAEIGDVYKYLMDFDKVDPANIRGLAFSTLYECVSWMESIGVLGFSVVVEIGGFYHPVIGEYEKTSDSGDEGNNNDGGQDLDEMLDEFFS